ncbi:hypothetical protein AG1IA_03020 [Rhizoctonia solani AG-1 IA]|uniref:Uncharacterized protein n=1 Tax=Thanatephorus cucumeris (strain AG1-IA) TaxID=983506 RepID=L8WY67_THACA|nr:hypothetical protein AG1IA_03020 [Rhizoctonia solani AG-1 IA]
MGPLSWYARHSHAFHKFGLLHPTITDINTNSLTVNIPVLCSWRNPKYSTTNLLPIYGYHRDVPKILLAFSTYLFSDAGLIESL